MQKEKEKEISLDVSDIKEGFNYFYTDIMKSGIVLASSNDNKLVPIVLNTSVSKYEPLRTKPKKYLDNEKATDAVNHVKLVEKLLLGEPLDSVELVSSATLAITGEDWYVYTDENNTLHSRVINGISDSRRKYATEEMSIYLEPVAKLMALDTKGGVINGK